jgi:hypothetical protein
MIPRLQRIELKIHVWSVVFAVLAVLILCALVNL